jgi:uncharacterized protein with von Willebrand factor type A (vWA) domain
METPIIPVPRCIENSMQSIRVRFEVHPTVEKPTWSAQERLRRKDFEQMTPEELRAAEEALAAYREQLADVGSRPLVVLADVSGPMEPYTRMLLRFAHAIAGRGRPVHALACSTRLASLTRHLGHADADAALNAARSAIPDWAGAAQMGDCLGELNRRWSRIVQGARVLLMTHGVGRDDTAALANALGPLHKACSELIWLNPLLRRHSFQAKAAGIEDLLPHVDHLLPVHNLQSFDALALLLREPGGLTTC